MSTSEQTSASKEPNENTHYYCDQCDGCGWYEGGPAIKTLCKYCSGTGWGAEKPRPSPQQQPDTTLDNPNLEQLIKAMFPAHNYGTSNKQKVANATSTAGQPDELSKAQERIRELEAENEQLRSERDKMKEENERLKQELQDEKDYLHGIIKQTEQDAAREIDKYRP